MRAVSAYAKSKNADSNVKGTKLVIDGQAYSYQEMKDLPHGLSIEAAKTIEVEDGVAFQTNIHFCRITIDVQSKRTTKSTHHRSRHFTTRVRWKTTVTAWHILVYKNTTRVRS